MKKTILLFMILSLVLELNAQNYRKIDPYIEAITKYEKFAAKAVDDYSLSLYQDSRSNGVRETLLTKLKEDRHILSKHNFSVNKDSSYTEGLIDFISLLIEYFEKNVGEFNIEEDAKTISYEELENRFKIYNFYADKIEKKFITLIQLKEKFSFEHGLPIKIEYARDVYKNQFFRYCGKFIEIVAKIDFADIKLQEAIQSKNSIEMNYHYGQLQNYLNQGKINIENLGIFNENDRMYLKVNSYINSFNKYQIYNKNKIDLIEKYAELKGYASTNSKDDYYYSQTNIYNANRQILMQQEEELLFEKSNLVLSFNEELNEFQKEHLGNLINNEIKIKNTLFSKDSLSAISKD